MQYEQMVSENNQLKEMRKSDQKSLIDLNERLKYEKDL